MKTCIITNSAIIKEITNNTRISKMFLHLDSKKKIAKYECDYTLYELTLIVNYDKAMELLKQL
jgi:hypothetical protein